jgi:UDP-N-acetylglucosamine 2-epimerase (non-hydrolysing)
VRVVSIVGARPQFVKLAPIDAACRAAGVEHVIVHTGQHYDDQLSDVFFRELGIQQPQINLEVGSASHALQTARIMEGLEGHLEHLRPEWTLVYGDTNSTLAASVVAVKLHLPLAHLEAGLRSFNRRMPEEHNRVLTDHAADLLLAPTQEAASHLEREGLGERTLVVGDVMTDVCLSTRAHVGGRRLAGTSAPFVLSTLHRAENTDDPARLASLVRAIAAIPTKVLLAAHPRLLARAKLFGIPLEQGSIRLTAPLGYRDLVTAVLTAEGVVTDSGGLQKEAYLLGTPCTTLRHETEWVETLRDGWNVLDPTGGRLRELAARPAPTAPRAPWFGDGHAAERVVAAMAQRCDPKEAR